MIDSDTERLREAFAKPSAIDRDRGVVEAFTHAGRVIMYVDRPGEYMDEHGRPVSDRQAIAAGFDLEADRLKGRKLERMEKARQQINELWENEKAAIRLADEAAPEAGASPSKSPSPHLTDEGYQKLHDTAS
jgi:hypothetical protein